MSDNSYYPINWMRQHRLQKKDMCNWNLALVREITL